MSRAVRWLGAYAVAGLMLGACGGPPEWSKDGVAPEVASADFAACQHEAQHDIQRDVNIDTDIAAGREHDWQHSNSTAEHTANDISSDKRLSREIVRGCMEAKGYAPSGPEPTISPHWWTMFDL